MMRQVLLLLFISLCISPFNALADSNYCIDEILLSGNDRTRDAVIYRHITVKEGQCFLSEHSLRDALKKSRQNLDNTGLFVETTSSVVKEDNELVVTFDVRERWYIFPSPIFELADRNFNEWYNDHNASLSRTNYGIRVKDYNFRGNEEELLLHVESGYTDSYRLTYRAPALDKNRNWGMQISLAWDNYKEVAFQTKENRLQYLDHDKILHQRGRIGASLLHRTGHYFSQEIKAQYYHHEIDDHLADANNTYLSLLNEESVSYARISYQAEYDKRNRSGYPLSGFRLRGGTGIRMHPENIETMNWSVNFKNDVYLHLGHNYFLAGSVSGDFKFPDKQPYYHLNGLGYSNNLVRGYEPYVIHGHAYGLYKLELKNRLFRQRIDLSNWIPLRQFQVIPVEVYIKAHKDGGYVASIQDESNNGPLLNNRILQGYGIGLDIVTSYDKVARFEYSVTDTGKEGFFIHFRRGI